MERITKKLNDTLAALKLGSVEVISEHKASSLNHHSSAEAAEKDDASNKINVAALDKTKSRSREPSADAMTSLRSLKSHKHSSGMNLINKSLGLVHSPKSDEK